MTPASCVSARRSASHSCAPCAAEKEARKVDPNLLLRYQPGDQVTITLYRPEEDTTLEVEITLLADKGETQE